MQKQILMLILIFVLASAGSAQDNIREIPLSQVQEAFNRFTPPHPRLFLNDQQLPQLLQKIKTSEKLTALHKAILKQADNYISQPPLEPIKTGRRMLSISRKALQRLLALSWAYRSSGDEKYLKRAEKEMLAISNFTDWNPPHFLDVAEMTTAMAIGYDWLYNSLPPESRATIRRAIIEKGINPSIRKDRRHCWWISRENNWNQVCHGGMVCGALAVMEDEEELAESIIHRAVNKVQISMNEYEPNGVYPEGPSYWVYGTTYNVLLLAALDSVLGDDFGLSQKNGFSKSAEFYLHAAGPENIYFNYSDCGQNQLKSLIPAVFWMSKKYNDPALAWSQQRLWEKAVDSGNTSSLANNRTAVMALIWATPETLKPKTLTWMGRGKNPVATFRSGWDKDATYLAIKGGSPSINHGHMDVGSFVIDAAGFRWASDLGPEGYHKIESLGLDLWNHRQNSDRWKIFRYNNFSHNTLTVNNQHQRVDSYAPIIRYSADNPFPHVVIDMTQAYNDQLKKVLRTAALLPSGQILIHDQLLAADKAATVRWAMTTGAKVSIQSDTTATLNIKDKTMEFNVLTDADIKLKTYSTEPRADYDAKNPDTRMIGFEISLNPGEKATTAVIMTPPSSSKPKNMDTKQIQSWLRQLQ